MKRSVFWSVICCLLCATVCWLYLRATAEEPDPEPIAMEIQFEDEDTEKEPAGYDEQTTILVQLDDGEMEMTLHDYLVGVLLAEVPSNFAPEALKAQAVAARTFTLKQIENGKHDGAVCTQSSCCQAWTPPEDEAQATAKQTMEQAVTQTDGCVITYDGALIDAVFFSCSGGRTEPAVAVWGGEVPYLQSVESPGEEEAAPFTDSMTVSVTDFVSTIHEITPDADLTGQPEDWFGEVTYTEGGGVDTIVIGGEILTGKQLRAAFSLRSTMFEITTEDDQITFHTMGYGHRVGMSQYGADAMAKAGADYQEIISYYYQGTEIQTR